LSQVLEEIWTNGAQLNMVLHRQLILRFRVLFGSSISLFLGLKQVYITPTVSLYGFYVCIYIYNYIHKVTIYIHVRCHHVNVSFQEYRGQDSANGATRSEVHSSAVLRVRIEPGIPKLLVKISPIDAEAFHVTWTWHDWDGPEGKMLAVVILYDRLIQASEFRTL
jgi:hypothetical protein